MDAQHVSYEVVFPRDLEQSAATAFLHAVSGLTTHPGRPDASVVPELYGDHQNIRHYISVPVGKADYVHGQLLAHIPGIRLAREHRPEVDWTCAIELESRTIKPEKVATAVDDVRSLLESLRRLAEGEVICLQLVVVPRKKAEDDPEAMYMVAIRLMVKAGHPKRAAHLLSRTLGPVRSLHRYGLDFREQLRPGWLIKHKAARRLTPVLTYPSLLPASALLVLMGIPLASPVVSGLSLSRGRKLAPDASLPSEGFVLGAANFPGMERPIAITPRDALSHTYAIGPTNSGKTALLQNLAIQQMDQGHGVTVIDGDGDLSRDLLNRVPKHRVEDVVYFNPTDDKWPIGFNPLAGDPYLVTDQFMGVFDRLFDVNRLHQTADVLRFSVLSLASLGLTILDIPALLTVSDRGQGFREWVMRSLTDPVIRRFWDWYDNLKANEQAAVVAPVMRRLRRFEWQPSLRACLGQAESGFDLDRVLNQGKILLVHIPRGQIGEDASATIGSLVVAKIWSQALERSRIPEDRRRPHYLHIDEFHKHLNMAGSVEDVFAQARKYKLGLHVAHQNLDQLPLYLRGGMAANCRNKVMFGMAAPDAAQLARELRGYMEPQQLQGLDLYEVVATIGAAPPATLKTFDKPPVTGTAKAVIEWSRSQYGQASKDVDAEIARRQRGLRSLGEGLPVVGTEPV